eukprot:scaffold23606_cov108-Isochrysis_galbana.AAC.3
MIALLRRLVPQYPQLRLVPIALVQRLDRLSSLSRTSIPDVRFKARARLRLRASTAATGPATLEPSCTDNCLMRSRVWASSLAYCSESNVSFETAVTYESSCRSAARRRSASRIALVMPCAELVLRGDIPSDTRMRCLHEEPG